MSINFLVTVIICNIIFIFTYEIISRKFDLYDHPDFSRKLHKKKISLTGGFLFFVIFLVYFICSLFFNLNIFFTLKEIISLMTISSIFFFIGLFDDKYSLKPNSKLILTIISSLSLILFNDNFEINELNFSFYPHTIILGNFSVLFTIICVLCFINACNMFDGIDLQFGFYLIVLSIFFLTKNLMPIFFLSMIISTLFFLNYNYQKKLFIGNNGTLFISSIFSFLFIIGYTKGIITYADEIFLIMAIPGFDLIRVSILRLLKGSHMFKPDNQHIHHLLIKNQGIIKTNFLIQLSIISPILIFYFYKNFLISFVISITMYLGLIIYAKKSIN